MTAILLAAGVGKRMGPGAPPKCLLRVGGRTLLKRTIEALRAAGVRRLVLVVGYEAQAVTAEAKAHAQDFVLTVLTNPRYQEGAILSLWAAREAFTDDLLIMDADVLCPSAFLELLVSSPHENCLLVDGLAQDTGEEQIVLGKDGRVLEITKRPSEPLKRELAVFGESVGFLKLSRPAAARLRDLIEHRVQAGQVTIEHEQVYPELFQTIPVGFERVDGRPWIELDTPEDVRRAEQEVYPRFDPLPCVNRLMAHWFLPWVLRLPLTPNQWTAISFGLGLVSLACFTDGRYLTGVLAALLFEAFYLADNWDGEVARARGLSSKWGGWFDLAVDTIIQSALPLALAIGLARQGMAPWVLGAGWIAAVGLLLDFLMSWWAKLRGFGTAVYGDPSRDRLQGGWRVNLTHENFSLLVATILLLDWRLPFLMALAAGSHLFWIRYLWVERARLLGPRYSLAQARR